MFDTTPLPVIRAAHFPNADGRWIGRAFCRAGHVLTLAHPDFRQWGIEHAACNAFRWVGKLNCVEAFALLGWECSEDELDHSKIHGLGPGRDLTAHPGDRLVPDGEGWFYPMAEDEYRRRTAVAGA